MTLINTSAIVRSCVGMETGSFLHFPLQFWLYECVFRSTHTYLCLVYLFCRSRWRSFWKGAPLLQARRSAHLSIACSPPTVSPLLLASSSFLISFSTVSTLLCHSEQLWLSFQKRCWGVGKEEVRARLTSRLGKSKTKTTAPAALHAFGLIFPKFSCLNILRKRCNYINKNGKSTGREMFTLDCIVGVSDISAVQC